MGTIRHGAEVSLYDFGPTPLFAFEQAALALSAAVSWRSISQWSVRHITRPCNRWTAAAQAGPVRMPVPVRVRLMLPQSVGGTLETLHRVAVLLAMLLLNACAAIGSVPIADAQDGIPTLAPIGESHGGRAHQGRVLPW
ncbi:MAG: hypothetical protein K0Q60_1853 [Microvirga sp.]|nr:hypothetical protein [Microvirga sp.]